MTVSRALVYGLAGRDEEARRDSRKQRQLALLSTSSTDPRGVAAALLDLGQMHVSTEN